MTAIGDISASCTTVFPQLFYPTSLRRTSSGCSGVERVTAAVVDAELALHWLKTASRGSHLQRYNREDVRVEEVTRMTKFSLNSLCLCNSLFCRRTFTGCNRGVMMIGKFLSQLLGNAGEDFEAADDTCDELMEFEEGGWVIVNLPENGPLSVPDVDPLENLLIEHPSMSVYQMRCKMSGVDEEEELGSDDEQEDTSRPVAVRRHVSWRLAAWGIPLPCNIQLMAVQRAARTQVERKKLSRSALHRQNMAKTRFYPAEKRYGHFKQPCQRLYNY